MSSHTSRLRTRSEPGPTVPSASLASLIGFPVAAFALLVVASYPLASVAVLAVTALATKAVQVTLAALVRRTNGAPRRVTVPGVGEVTISVAPV